LVDRKMTRAPLNNGILPLRDLKRTGARRTSQVMAVALGKKCNAATVRFRARPSGPTGCSALCVASFRQADACLQTVALIAKQPVGQRPYAIVQRCPCFPEVDKALGNQYQAYVLIQVCGRLL
jgi:hypothetical protein